MKMLLETSASSDRQKEEAKPIPDETVSLDFDKLIYSKVINLQVL